MKKIFLISILVILCTVSFAQLRYFFPDSNACFSAGSFKFWFNGDTTINSLKYKKVYMQTYDSIPDFSHAMYYAALREDTLAEKVYLIEAQEDRVERLIYDFSLGEGDTARVYSFSPYMSCNHEDGYVAVIESVDSVLVGGNYRKRLVLEQSDTYSNQWFELWWIEGIGSTNGPFTPLEICCADCEYVWPLLCVHIDGELVYQPYSEVEGIDGCYLNWSTGKVKESEIKYISIYPTFVDDVLSIETFNDEVTEIRYSIYNTLGMQIDNGNLCSTTINVSDLDRGMYIIILYISDNVYSECFIKK